MSAKIKLKERERERERVAGFPISQMHITWE